MCLGGGAIGYAAASQIGAKSQQPYPRATAISGDQLVATDDYGTHIAATIQALEGGVLLRDAWAWSSLEEDGDNYSIHNTKDGLVLTYNGSGKYWGILAYDMPYDIDVSVTAQALPNTACENWSFALDIRHPNDYQHTKPFYNFKVLNSGTWYFGWYDGNQEHTRSLTAGVIDPPIDMFQPTTMRVVALGSHFDLYLNDMLVGSANDVFAVPADKNAVGVSIETCSGKASAQFTNLIIKTPR